MEVLVISTILKTLISEGLKAIFKPLRERLYRYYKIETLTRSILKRITIYIKSEEYDFEGYLEIVINSDLLANISDPDILEIIEDALKKKFVNKLNQYSVINVLKEKLKQDSYLSMEFLKEKLTLEFFFDLFGDPKLDVKGNEKKKKVVESIWRTFNVEALKVVQTKDVIIEMYIELQGNMEEIKKSFREIIARLPIKENKSEKRKIYNKLWHLLVDLQFTADELWSNATEEGIRKFITIYREVFKNIKKDKYGLKPDHKSKLEELLHQFELYYDGKKLFVDTKKRALEEQTRRISGTRIDKSETYIDWIPVEEVLKPIVENNRKIRNKYLKLLSEISDHFDEILMES